MSRYRESLAASCLIPRWSARSPPRRTRRRPPGRRDPAEDQGRGRAAAQGEGGEAWTAGINPQGGGLFVKSPDGKALFRLYGYAQPTFTYTDRGQRRRLRGDRLPGPPRPARLLGRLRRPLQAVHRDRRRARRRHGPGRGLRPGGVRAGPPLPALRQVHHPVQHREPPLLPRPRHGRALPRPERHVRPAGARRAVRPHALGLRRQGQEGHLLRWASGTATPRPAPAWSPASAATRATTTATRRSRGG